MSTDTYNFWNLLLQTVISGAMILTFIVYFATFLIYRCQLLAMREPPRGRMY